MAFDQTEPIRQPEASLTSHNDAKTLGIDFRELQSLPLEKRYGAGGPHTHGTIEKEQYDFGSPEALNTLYGEGTASNIAGRYVAPEPGAKTLVYRPDKINSDTGSKNDIAGRYVPSESGAKTGPDNQRVHQPTESGSVEDTAQADHTEHSLLIFRPSADGSETDETIHAHAPRGDRSTDTALPPGDLRHEGADGDLEGRLTDLLEKFGEIMKEFQETMKEYLELLEEMMRGGAGGGGTSGGGGAGGGGTGGGDGGADGGDGGTGGGDGGTGGAGKPPGGGSPQPPGGGSPQPPGGGDGTGGDGGDGDDGMPPGFPPGFPPDVDKTLDGVWVDPPAPYGQGRPFPDRGRSSGYDVPVNGTTDAIRELEENGVAPPDAPGLTSSVTKPAPEIWRRLETKDGQIVYLSMQQALDTNPFDGKSVYQKGADGSLTVKEQVSYDPLVMYTLVASPTNPGGQVPPAGDLYYRGTDGNLHKLEGKIVHRPGEYHGKPGDGWYDLEFQVPKDMAFVRQQWVEGSGFPKIAEKIMVDGKIMTLFEASKLLGS
ncbi:MAG TPA: hypothetical protein V6D17_04455 [Candidatus Obscuribacterales bacterium]